MDNTMEERLDFIEFRQELLCEDNPISRWAIKHKISREQYSQIKDLVAEYKAYIEDGQSVAHTVFESKVYKIIPKYKDNHSYVDEMWKAFYESNIEQDVFYELYGGLVQYNTYFNKFSNK